MKVSGVSPVTNVSEIANVSLSSNVSTNVFENLLVRRARLTEMIDELKPVEIINNLSFPSTKNAISLSISDNAKQSKYWNNENINFPIINSDVQSYTKNLMLEQKRGY